MYVFVSLGLCALGRRKKTNGFLFLCSTATSGCFCQFLLCLLCMGGYTTCAFGSCVRDSWHAELVVMSLRLGANINKGR